MSQDATMSELEAKRNEILVAMQTMAEAEPVPGEVRVGDVVHNGDETLDAQMIISGIKGAGVVYIYDSRTGERSRTNKNMIPTQLAKKREDGSQVFTTTDPGIEPVRGHLRCMLHPADPNRALYDTWGLVRCSKEGMPNILEVKRHMQSRHPRAWETIEAGRKDEQAEQDRKLQQEILRRAARAQDDVGDRPERSRKAG